MDSERVSDNDHAQQVVQYIGKRMYEGGKATPVEMANAQN
jgi:hypothetical protein